MFYIQNQYFFSRDLFFIFDPYSFPTFCWRALESLFICSLVLAQPRFAYLDITEKLLTGTLRININKIVIYVSMEVKTSQDLKLKLR